MVHGHYGEFKVLVDGETVIDGGALAALGLLPSGSKVVKVVRARLADQGVARVPDANEGS